MAGFFYILYAVIHAQCLFYLFQYTIYEFLVFQRINMAGPSRKTFNNILIIGILLFIALINLPSYLRSQLSENKSINTQTDQNLVYLFPQDENITALTFSHFTLTKNPSWQSSIPLLIDADELAMRWLGLSGTKVDKNTFEKLAKNLPPASNLTIHLQNDKIYSLHYYQFPQFWLLQNIQNDWLALSVEPNYLFPLSIKE